MKRMSVIAGFTVSVAMLLCTISVLIRPVLADSCSAKCAGGGQVTCYGHSCTAKDGQGCRSYDQNGTLIIAIPCNGQMELE